MDNWSRIGAQSNDGRKKNLEKKSTRPSFLTAEKGRKTMADVSGNFTHSALSIATKEGGAKMVPKTGIEPATFALRVRCSTD